MILISDFIIIMLVLLISIVSVIIVIGVATTIYVQNSKQKKQYDEKLTEVVSKTDHANQYEYEKNKDQEVALDKVKGDMMAYNQSMAAVKKDVDFVKTSYDEKINNLGTSISDMQKQTNIFQTDVTKIDNTQNTQINTLTGDVTNIKKDVTNLNSQYAVINGKIVNINDKQQLQIDKLYKNYDSMMVDHGGIVNNMAALKNDLNSTSATQNKSITDFQNSTKQTLADQKITADNVFNKATSVENNVKTLNTALDNLKQSLNDYMLKVNMKDYASQSDLTDVKTNLQNDLKNVQSIFNNYMTKTDFNTFKTSLPDYPTRSEMSTLVNNFLTKSEVQNINATIASVQTSINNFQGVITSIKDTYATKNDLLKVSGDASQGTVNIQSLYVMLDGVQKNLTSMQTNITSVRDGLTKFQTDANNAYALKTDVLNLTKYIDQQTTLIKQNITNTFDKLTVNSTFTANGDLTLNNMKFSRNYSGFPETGIDKSEISNDTTNFKKLMIVGNKSAGGVRSVGVWDKLDVYGDLSATNITGSKLTTDKGIAITNNDPGSLIEKKFGSSGDRYGIGYSAGVTRMYAATAYPGKTSLSQAKADGSFDDVLTINSDKSIDMNTAKINLPGANNIYTKGRQHMSGDELLYILNKQGAVIGKEWGGSGDLSVQGNATIGGTAAVTGNITGDQVFSNKGVVIKNDNPGPLVEKNYGGNNNRYGVGQFDGGVTRMYTATAYGGKTALSQAKADGSFDDVLVVNPDKSINMNTPTINLPNANNINTKGRQHISGDEELYVLNKKGAIIGKEWGGSGDLSVQGNATVQGKICINSTCITEADLKKLQAQTNGKGTIDNPGVSGIDIKNSGVTTSGWYYIKTSLMQSAKKVYVNMDDDGGGWMLVSYNPTVQSLRGNLYPSLWVNGEGTLNKLSTDVNQLWYHNRVAQCTSLLKMATTSGNQIPLLANMIIANKVVYSNPGILNLSKNPTSLTFVDATALRGTWYPIKGHTQMTSPLAIIAPADWVYNEGTGAYWLVCNSVSVSSSREGKGSDTGSFINISSSGDMYGMADVSLNASSYRGDLNTYAVYIK